jgi:hypothetical protein
MWPALIVVVLIAIFIRKPVCNLENFLFIIKTALKLLNSILSVSKAVFSTFFYSRHPSGSRKVLVAPLMG